MNDEAGQAAAQPAADRGVFPSWVNWSARDALLGVLIGMLAGFILAPALVLPFDPELESDAGLLVAQALLGVTLAAVAVAVPTKWTFKPLGETWRRLGLRPFKAEAIAWILVTLFTYYLLAGLFATYVLEPDQDDIGGELGVGDENVIVAVAAVVLIAGVAPFAEEVFFRGFLFGGLRKALPLWPAALISGLIFGGIHLPTGPSAVIPLAALGVGLAWLYEKSQSLWPAVIAHAINNGLALAFAGQVDDESLAAPFLVLTAPFA